MNQSKLKTSFLEYAGRDILDIEELEIHSTIASACKITGAGKTSLLKILSGNLPLRTPTSGAGSIALIGQLDEPDLMRPCTW